MSTRLSTWAFLAVFAWWWIVEITGVLGERSPWLDLLLSAAAGAVFVSAGVEKYRNRPVPVVVAEPVVMDYCLGCDTTVDRAAMGFGPAGEYACNVCRGEPAIRAIEETRQAGHAGDATNVAPIALGRSILRACKWDPGQIARWHEVAGAPGHVPEVVAVKATELTRGGPVTLPAGTKVGAIETPDGRTIPIVAAG